MAAILSSRTAPISQAPRSTTQRRAQRVVAQAVGPRAAEAQQQHSQQRVLVATQASATWAPLQQQQEQAWLSHLAQLFGAQPQQQQEDEEWKQLFGSYLDPAEEAGGHRHGM